MMNNDAQFGVSLRRFAGPRFRAITLALVCAFIPQIVSAGIVEDIDACISAWHDAWDDTDAQFNGNYGSNPNWGEWHDGLQQAQADYHACIQAAISGASNAMGFGFHHRADTNPVGYTFQFNNTWGAADTFLTVQSATADNGSRFVDARIKVNGSTVATTSDFDGHNGFRKQVALVSGQNTITLECDADEFGGMVLILDDNEYSHADE